MPGPKTRIPPGTPAAPWNCCSKRPRSPPKHLAAGNTGFGAHELLKIFGTLFGSDGHGLSSLPRRRILSSIGLSLPVCNVLLEHFHRIDDVVVGPQDNVVLPQAGLLGGAVGDNVLDHHAHVFGQLQLGAEDGIFDTTTAEADPECGLLRSRWVQQGRSGATAFSSPASPICTMGPSRPSSSWANANCCDWAQMPATATTDAISMLSQDHLDLRMIFTSF